MRIEQITPDRGPPLPFRLLLRGWWRVIARDGTTIAYCPGQADAHLIAAALDVQHPAEEPTGREHG